MKINVLGTEYDLLICSKEDDARLNDMDGYCDPSVKKCVVNNCESEKSDLFSKQNLEQYKSQVTRHELVHAFIYESGLSACSWGENEEMVDWIAIQFPKILKAFEAAKVI